MKLKDSIIIILVFIIAIVIGVFAGVKFTEEKQGNNDINQDDIIDDNKNNNVNQDNDVNNENDETSWVSGDVTKDSVKNKDGYEEVKQLVDKYRYKRFISNGPYMAEINNRSKVMISIINTDVSEEIDYRDERVSDIICIVEDYGYYSYGSGCAGSIQDSQYVPVYSYESVLKSMKKLFGSNQTIEMENINTGGCIHYSSKLNSFAYGNCGAPIDTAYSIEDFEYGKGSLNVTVKNVDTTVPTASGSYLYTFKQENNNYYLADITQLD